MTAHHTASTAHLDPRAPLTKSTHLPDRGVVAVTGGDATKFLDNLITNDMGLLRERTAMFAGLLSPQGKILFDFLVVKQAQGYLLDTPAALAAGLVKRLSMYKLRADVKISDVSAEFFVRVAFSQSRPGGYVLDPRHGQLGSRHYAQTVAANAEPQTPDVTEAADYHAHRIALGVPEGGRDYAYGDTFPHEALFDHVEGVSFTKGCYIGQEIVARMEHRGTARKRIVRVTGTETLPPTQTPILAGDIPIGTLGSSARRHGLAMLRLDRVLEFQAKGEPLMCGGQIVMPNADDIASLMPHPADAAGPL